MKKLMFLLLFLFPGLLQAGNIDIKVHNYNSSKLYLCYYIANTSHVMAELISEDNSNFTIDTDTLVPGMYMILDTDTIVLFKFLLDKGEMSGRYEIDKSDINNSLQIKGSKLNSDFHDYLKYTEIKSAEISPYKQRIKSKELSNNDNLALQKEIYNINQEVKQYTKTLIKKHKKDILGVILKAELPLDVKFSPNTPMQKRRAATFKMFWENVDLSDERLLRSPVLHERVTTYLDDLLIQTPDSIAVGIDNLIARIDPKSENMRYVLTYVTNKYEKSKVMGQDKVFVHIIDNYYATGFDTWTHPVIVEALIDKANDIRPTLIGNKGANLTFLDKDMKAVSLYDINTKYTVIYFWNDNCPLCEEYSERLVKLYENSKEYDFEIYGVFTGSSSNERMINYIDKKGIKWINVNGALSPSDDDYHVLYNIYSTPNIYLLDENKTIIAKKLNIKNLSYLLKRKTF